MPHTYACCTTATSALLRAPARLKKAREVAALPQLRDLQLDLTGSRVPPPRAISVAVRRPILRPALAELRPDQLRHLRLHQLLDDPAHRLAHDIGVILQQNLPDDLLDRHPFLTGHQWCLLSR